MSTRSPRITSASSSLELLAATYFQEAELIKLLQPAVIGPRAELQRKELMRIRRLVKSHLIQQGVRVDDHDQRSGP